MRLLDGDGTYANYPSDPVYSKNPAYDMKVYDTIRYNWNKMRNEELKKSGKKRNT